MHSAFPHWSVNTGKCLGVAPDQQGTQKPTLVVVECASSNQVLIFDQLADDGGTIRLLTDPDKCLSTGTTGVLEFRACDEGTSEFFIKTDHLDGHKISLKGDHHKCISALDRNNYEIGAQFDMKQCEGNATPLGFMETKVRSYIASCYVLLRHDVFVDIYMRLYFCLQILYNLLHFLSSQ
ncbi:MAG: hypothetical protein ACI8RD_004283 [Bacillariaceae sp.]|jgi:hypothetical protein